MQSSFAQENSAIDTLKVSQNDTLFFEKKVVMNRRPCSKPSLYTYYELKNPKDGVYYLIFNDKAQLVKSGTYTAEFKNGDVVNDRGGFYDSKYYSYKNNGNLTSIHYQVDGRNFKTENFDRKGRFKKIKYINKRSENTDSIEIYKKGKLAETRIYYSFANYNTVKAQE